MSKTISGTIENVAEGQNLLGLYAYRLLISNGDKLIRITDCPYSKPNVWTVKDIGKTGIFEYRFSLLEGKVLKRSITQSCKLTKN